MTAQEVRAGLQVDPFSIRASKGKTEWIIRWYALPHEDGPTEEVALASFIETEEGIEWTRFYVLEPFRKMGIYTTALRWSLALDVNVTAAANVQPETWAGFKLTKDGNMKIDKRVAKARVKDR